MTKTYDNIGRFSGNFPPDKQELKEFELRLSKTALRQLDRIDKLLKTNKISQQDHDIMSKKVMDTVLQSEHANLLTATDKRILGKKF